MSYQNLIIAISARNNTRKKLTEGRTVKYSSKHDILNQVTIVTYPDNCLFKLGIGHNLAYCYIDGGSNLALPAE